MVRVDRLASTSVMPDVVHVNGDKASYLDLTFACTYVSGEAHVGRRRVQRRAVVPPRRDARDGCGHGAPDRRRAVRGAGGAVRAPYLTARADPLHRDVPVVAPGDVRPVEATTAVEQVVVTGSGQDVVATAGVDDHVRVAGPPAGELVAGRVPDQRPVAVAHLDVLDPCRRYRRGGRAAGLHADERRPEVQDPERPAERETPLPRRAGCSWCPRPRRRRRPGRPGPRPSATW